MKALLLSLALLTPLPSGATGRVDEPEDGLAERLARELEQPEVEVEFRRPAPEPNREPSQESPAEKH